MKKMYKSLLFCCCIGISQNVLTMSLIITTTNSSTYPVSLLQGNTSYTTKPGSWTIVGVGENGNTSTAFLTYLLNLEKLQLSYIGDNVTVKKEIALPTTQPTIISLDWMTICCEKQSNPDSYTIKVVDPLQ